MKNRPKNICKFYFYSASKQPKCISILSNVQIGAWNYFMVGVSPRLAGKGGDLQSRGCDFDFRRKILDGHFYINLLEKLHYLI